MLVMSFYLLGNVNVKSDDTFKSIEVPITFHLSTAVLSSSFQHTSQDRLHSNINNSINELIEQTQTQHQIVN